MAKIYTSITELIGGTPLVELKNFSEGKGLKARIFAKLEFFNPAGSVKDRVAYKMITDAEEKGILKKGATVIEPTSGNTGIGIAAVAAAKGYKAILTMPETMSVERRKLLAAYGAEIVLTDGKKGMAGAIERAEELNGEIENSVILGQFTNRANPQAHIETTGVEIWKDTDGLVDIFVGGIGTGGTVTGTAKFLKSKCENIKIVGYEPSSSPFLTEGTGGAHKIQGIGAGFEPEIFDRSVVDEIMTVTDEEAYACTKEIARKEGFLVGISSGGALAAAVKVAQREENDGKTVVVLFPDSGERYLSTGVFD